MSASPTRMNAHERRIITVTCTAHFLSHFNMLVFPALVLPLSDRLGLPLADVLAIALPMYLLFGLAALPWGLAGDRWGAPPLLLLFFGCSSLAAGAAALTIDAAPMLGLSLALLGLFSAIYHPTGLGLISKEVRRISIGLAYNGMAGNLGIALAPLVAGLAVWRAGPAGAYWMVAALNLCGVLLMIGLRRRGRTRPNPQPATPVGACLPAFGCLLIAMALGGFVYRGATLMLPAYLELRNTGLLAQVRALVPTDVTANLHATLCSALIFSVAIAGQYLGGRVAERTDIRWSYCLFHLLTIPAAVCMALLSDLPLLAVAAGYFLFLLGMQPIENTLVARFTPTAFRHAAYGTKFILTFGIGALSVVAVGQIEQRWGIQLVYPALGCVSALLVMTALVLIRITRDRA